MFPVLRLKPSHLCSGLRPWSLFREFLVRIHDSGFIMAAASRYRKFLKLCELWPVDASKTDRDLGLYIRRRIAEGFRQGDATEIDVAECDRIYNSLHRIASNHFRRSYPRLRNNNFSGLNSEQCQIMNSSDTLETLNRKRFKFW